MVLESPDAENLKAEKENAANVGALLKASRLRLGDDLRYVAETLHIRYIYLEAIENSQYDLLPGAAYAIGFIRTYADYLGLDSAEVVRRYKVESETKSVNTALVFPVPIPESSIPAGAIVFVGVIIALLAYGGWYVSTTKDGFLAGLVSPVPERLAEDTSAVEPELKPEPEPAMEESPVTEPGDTVEEAVERTEQDVESATEAVENADEQTSQATEEVSAVVEKVEPAAAQESASTIAEASQQVAASSEKVEETVAPVVETVAPAVETAESEATATVKPVMETAPEATEEAEKVVEKKIQSATTEETPPAAEEAAAVETPEPASVPEPTQETVSAVEAAAPNVDEVEAEPDTSAAAETATQVATTTEVTSSATATESESARVYGADQTNSRIVVKARKNSWIQVRDNIANRLVMTRLLRAGDSYRVPDQEGLVLLTGNAGALEIMVDGEAVPDLGGAGAVRRNVALNPALLRQGTAAQ